MDSRNTETVNIKVIALHGTPDVKTALKSVEAQCSAALQSEGIKITANSANREIKIKFLEDIINPNNENAITQLQALLGDTTDYIYIICDINHLVETPFDPEKNMRNDALYRLFSMFYSPYTTTNAFSDLIQLSKLINQVSGMQRAKYLTIIDNDVNNLNLNKEKFLRNQFEQREFSRADRAELYRTPFESNFNSLLERLFLNCLLTELCQKKTPSLTG